MKAIILLIVAVVCAASAQSQPPYPDVCMKGEYPPDPKTLSPTRVVNLDLPPNQRWNEIGKEFQKPIKTMLNFIKIWLLEFSPKFSKIIKLVDNDLGKIVATLPSPYKGEIYGMANATGLPLGEITLFNVFYEIFTLCTSIVGKDLKGDTYHARNLDFGLFLGWDTRNDTWEISEMLRHLILNVNYTRGGKTQYTSVTFAGFVGVFTAVKPGVMTLSMNERFGGDGGFVGLFEWIVLKNYNQSWCTFLARDVFEQNIDYETAKHMLTKTPVLAPAYYIIGGPKPHQASIITRSRTAADDVWDLGTKNSTWFLVETNYDNWKAPLFIDDRRTPAKKCMANVGQAGYGFAGLFNVLSTKPVLNKLTVYSSLMHLNSGRTETYIQNCADPCWPF